MNQKIARGAEGTQNKNQSREPFKKTYHKIDTYKFRDPR